MTEINASQEPENLSELLNRVAYTGERVVIKRQGKEIAAIISSADLKRLEALEAFLLKKADLEEFQWLKAPVRNPAFDSQKAPEGDIYTLADGQPFCDPAWTETPASATAALNNL